MTMPASPRRYGDLFSAANSAAIQGVARGVMPGNNQTNGNGNGAAAPQIGRKSRPPSDAAWRRRCGFGAEEVRADLDRVEGSEGADLGAPRTALARPGADAD